MQSSDPSFDTILAALRERAKELQCLYRVDETLARGDAPMQEVLEELVRVLAQVEHDFGAACLACGFLDTEFTLAAGLPFHSGLVAGFAAEHCYFVGHHERTVEADAELTDQLRPLRCIAFAQGLYELLGTAAGDRSEMLDDR